MTIFVLLYMDRDKMSETQSPFIERMKKEIERINNEINKLVTERRFFEELIDREKLSLVSNYKHIRKNSATKVMVQSRIIHSLSRSNKEMKVNDLYKTCSEKYNISESSFRNYLFDLSKREIISKGSKSGYWKINPSVDGKNILPNPDF